MTSPRLTGLAILCLTLPLMSCATKPILDLPDPDSPVKAIPCTEAPLIPYHAPTDEASVAKWEAGTMPDLSNAFDTPGTVSAIRRANAAREAICGP